MQKEKSDQQQQKVTEIKCQASTKKNPCNWFAVANFNGFFLVVVATFTFLLNLLVFAAAAVVSKDVG